MFWFMLIALVAVVAAVALAVLGDGGALHDVEPDRLADRLPDDRSACRSDIDRLRLPIAVRGYRMADVDDVLDRLGAELTERDARIAELEAECAGGRAVALAKEKYPEAHQGNHRENHRENHQGNHRENHELPRPDGQPREG